MLRNINLIRKISSKSTKQFTQWTDNQLNIYFDNPEFTQKQIQAWLNLNQPRKNHNTKSIHNIKGKKYELPYLNNK